MRDGQRQPKGGRTRGISAARVVARSVAAVALAATLAGLPSCTAVVQGSALANRPGPNPPGQIFLTTGNSPWPYRTLGFIQVTGFGNQVAGVVDIGDAQIDSTIRGALANAAVQMGGHGVIHIEFLDENPQTPAEQANDLAQSIHSAARGRGEIKTRWRSVHATGEVVQFAQQ
jgi:hypothetical protein